MKIKNVTKENIKLIEELDLFTRKSQIIDFVNIFKTNKDISQFIEQYKQGTPEEKVGLHKIILQSLKSIYDKALFIQNYQVVNFFSILPYGDLKLLQSRYFKKGKPEGFDYKTHVFSSLPYLLLKYDTEMDFFNTTLDDYYYKVDINIELELKKIKQRIKLNKPQDKLPNLSSGQKNYIKQFKLNKYELNYLVRNGFNNCKYIDFTEVYSKLYNKLKKTYTRKTDELVKNKFKNLKELTYEGMIKDYFGVEIDTKSLMKLSKQLSKKGVEYTSREIQHFGEIKRWFDCVEKHRFTSLDCFKDVYFTLGKLYIDTEDFTIPDFVDNWAFNGSCNVSYSSAGGSTHLWLKELNFEYLKIYGLSRNLTKGKTELLPFARAYFYQDETGNIGHTGGYSDIHHNGNKEGSTAYEFWTVLLCILFDKKVDDFTWGIDGINMGTGEYYNWDERHLYIYSNAQCNTSYTKIGTDTDVFTNIGNREYLRKKTVLMDETGYRSEDEAREYTELKQKELNLYGE